MKNKKYFARPNGWHYHIEGCFLCADFDYIEISEEEIKTRKLKPCPNCIGTDFYLVSEK